MKEILFLLLFFPFIGSTQDSLKIETVLMDSSDSSLIAYVFISSENENRNPKYFNENKQFLLDSLLAGEYQYEYDYPFGRTLEIYEAIDAKEYVIYISSEEAISFMKKSKIKYYLPQYGYGTFPINDLLSEKYGVIILNMGCIVNHSYDEYISSVNKLLAKRNGLDWKINYRNDYKLKEGL